MGMLKNYHYLVGRYQLKYINELTTQLDSIIQKETYKNIHPLPFREVCIYAHAFIISFLETSNTI